VQVRLNVVGEHKYGKLLVGLQDDMFKRGLGLICWPQRVCAPAECPKLLPHLSHNIVDIDTYRLYTVILNAERIKIPPVDAIAKAC